MTACAPPLPSHRQRRIKVWHARRASDAKIARTPPQSQDRLPCRPARTASDSQQRRSSTHSAQRSSRQRTSRTRQPMHGSSRRRRTQRLNWHPPRFARETVSSGTCACTLAHLRAHVHAVLADPNSCFTSALARAATFFHMTFFQTSRPTSRYTFSSAPTSSASG